MKAAVFDFVGFVFSANDILVVFPKHFKESAEIEKLNSNNECASDDITLLRKVIVKYDSTSMKNAKALRHMGEKDDLDSDYPFQYFYRIYHYYIQFGLYRERQKELVTGKGMKISWKHTLQNSAKIISDDNLVFMPVYSEKWRPENVFVTDCMAYAIDYTIRRFSAFLSLRPTGYQVRRVDYVGNKNFVIQQLVRIKSTVFRDREKRLLDDIIGFFLKINTKNQSGDAHLEIRYFNDIWQEMVEHYLNRHFLSMSLSGDKAVFDLTVSRSSVKFMDTTFDDVDTSTNHFYIDVDHAGRDSTNLYLFDSKYYSDIRELNYKQFSYNMILNRRFSGIRNLYSVLLLPGSEGSKLHFKLSPSYAGGRSLGISIIEQYLEPKKVMEDYLAD